MLPYETRMEIK